MICTRCFCSPSQPTAGLPGAIFAPSESQPPLSCLWLRGGTHGPGALPANIALIVNSYQGFKPQNPNKHLVASSYSSARSVSLSLESHFNHEKGNIFKKNKIARLPRQNVFLTFKDKSICWDNWIVFTDYAWLTARVIRNYGVGLCAAVWTRSISYWLRDKSYH